MSPHVRRYHPRYLFFFFRATATPEIYTLSLHDALPIFRTFQTHHFSGRRRRYQLVGTFGIERSWPPAGTLDPATIRSEEHTSELQSRRDLVCRLLLEKKK